MPPAHFRNGGASNFRIIEWTDGVTDDLTLLVAFPRDDQNITLIEPRRRRPDCFSAVPDFDGAITTRHYLPSNCGSVLVAGIVVRDNDAVRITAGDFAHEGPLTLVPVATTAEHQDEPVRGMGSHRPQDTGQRIGRMCVVHIHVRPAWMGGRPVVAGRE